MPISEKSASPSIDAVRGESTAAGGTAIHGISDSGPGVHAVSTSGPGLEASSTTNYGIRASSKSSAGLRASSEFGRGAEGWSNGHEGVVGTSKAGIGVYGTGTGTAGVVGDTETGHGRGVEGRSGTATGVYGTSTSGSGVEGHGKTGGYFEGSFEGVHAVSHDPRAAGIAGYNDNAGPGLFGKSTGGGPAGYFDGDVIVTGQISFANADCAEDFDISGTERVEPGTVMIMGTEGALLTSSQAYDRRVAGVISGAGGYKPGLVLDRNGATTNRQPIALVGKVFCKVDASFGVIDIGDLLTSSPTPGHAMRTSDPLKAFGAIIGKALRPWGEGQGMIPILIALR
jgi:hypothetical protein